jgi:hypothetical protein
MKKQIAALIARERQSIIFSEPFLMYVSVNIIAWLGVIILITS